MIIKEIKPLFQDKLGNNFTERELESILNILIEKILGLSRAEVVLQAEEVIGPTEELLLLSAINELKKNKPVDYIINETEFFGRPFYVDENVLIPRPETEELVLFVMEYEKSDALTVLDIGTGSGCIPVSLYLESGIKHIDACDVSATAIEVAKKNAIKLKATNLKFEVMDILLEKPTRKYQVVISNPPYVKEEELTSLDQNVVEYEPVIALAPKGDPLTFYKRMIDLAPVMLEKGGRFYWEIHEDLGDEVIALLKNADFSEIELRQDLYGRDRLVRAVY